MWHWQQWFTAVLFAAGLAGFIVAALVDPKTARYQVGSLLLFLWMQFVLWSGGWYGP